MPRAEVEDVRRFYDATGWKRTQAGTFTDALAEDLRPVAAEYIAKTHARFGRCFPGSGRFFLDCASGPVQYDGYLPYSKGYERRVCVDISFTALVEARTRLEGHGLYVLADVNRLPFRDDAFDASMSMHTIYHLPPEDQLSAIAELVRVTRPERPLAVVYSLGRHSTLNRLLMLPARAARLLWTAPARLRPQRRERAGPPAAEASMGHFYPQPLGWVREEVLTRFRGDIGCWRSIGVPAMRALIHPALGGRLLLRVLFALEQRFPRLMGMIGQYPVIVLRKPADHDAGAGR